MNYYHNLGILSHMHSVLRSYLLANKHKSLWTLGVSLHWQTAFIPRGRYIPN